MSDDEYDEYASYSSAVPEVPTNQWDLQPPDCNTSSQSGAVNPCKHWLFTLNNYHNYNLCQDFIVSPNMENYIYGYEEAGSTGTPHIQGFVSFRKKTRPFTEYPLWGRFAHWEVMKTTIPYNIRYCSKEGNYRCSPAYSPPNSIRLPTSLRQWQAELCEELITPSNDDRKIKWIYDNDGGSGKTVFCRYMCVRHNALVVGGRAIDAQYGIIKWMENNHGKAPKIVLYNTTRNQKIDYQGLESIKDGIFFSAKYESQMCVFDSPKVVVFANGPPDEERLSKDRWDIVKL